MFKFSVLYDVMNVQRVAESARMCLLVTVYNCERLSDYLLLYIIY